MPVNMQSRRYSRNHINARTQTMKPAQRTASRNVVRRRMKRVVCLLRCAQRIACFPSVSQDTSSPKSLAARPPVHWNGPSIANTVRKKHKFMQGLYTCTDDRILNSSQNSKQTAGSTKQPHKRSPSPLTAISVAAWLQAHNLHSLRLAWLHSHKHTLGDRLTTEKAWTPTQSTSSPTRGRERCSAPTKPCRWAVREHEAAPSSCCC